MMKNAKGMGTIVTWMMAGLTSREALLHAIHDAGFPDIPIPEAEPKTFLRRAIAECVEADLVRIIGEDEKVLSFAVVNESTNLASASWRGDQTLTVQYNKKDGTLVGGDTSTLIAQIKVALDKGEGILIGREVGTVVRRVIQRDADAIALRRRGGVYFVPAAKSDVLDRIDEVLEKIASNTATHLVTRFGVMADARGADDIAEIVQAAYKDEVIRLRKKAVELSRIDKTRPSSILTKKKEVEELLYQAKRYEEVLGRNLSSACATLSNARLFLLKLHVKMVGEAVRATRFKKRRRAS